MPVIIRPPTDRLFGDEGGYFYIEIEDAQLKTFSSSSSSSISSESSQSLSSSSESSSSSSISSESSSSTSSSSSESSSSSQSSSSSESSSSSVSTELNAWDYSEDFESPTFTAGNPLHGIDGWANLGTNDQNPIVDDNISYTGTQCVELRTTATNQVCGVTRPTPSAGSYSSGTFYFAARSWLKANHATHNVYIGLYDNAPTNLTIRFQTDHIEAYAAGNWKENLVLNYQDNTWYVIGIEFDINRGTNGQFRCSVNNGSFGSWHEFAANTEGIYLLKLQGNSGSNAWHVFYVDSIGTDNPYFYSSSSSSSSSSSESSISNSSSSESSQSSSSQSSSSSESSSSESSSSQSSSSQSSSYSSSSSQSGVSSSSSESAFPGSHVFGHETDVNEYFKHNFADGVVTGGSISGSGNYEKVTLESGQYWTSSVVRTGANMVQFVYGKYRVGSGTAGTFQYKTGVDKATCLADTWHDYTGPFQSSGWVQLMAIK